jgi:hypothetical protein
MQTRKNPQSLPPHSQKIKDRKEQDLDLDFDGDGLTEREELKYGLNPLSPDTDGDNLYNGKEVEEGTNPHQPTQEPPAVETGSDKERYRDNYLRHAQTVLNNPVLTYGALYNQIQGEEWLGSALDEQVMNAAVQSGQVAEEIQCLIAQSPYLQWQLSHGNWERGEAIGYIEGLTSQLQAQRKQEELTE